MVVYCHTVSHTQSPPKQNKNTIIVFSNLYIQKKYEEEGWNKKGEPAVTLLYEIYDDQ